MTFRVLIFPTSTKEQNEQGAAIATIDHAQIDEPTLEALASRLQRRGYTPHEQVDHLLINPTDDLGITVRIRPTRVDFWVADGTKDGAIFEALQTASELTDGGTISCYDPQTAEWIT